MSKVCGMRWWAFALRVTTAPVVIPLLIVAAIGHCCEKLFDWIDKKMPM